MKIKKDGYLSGFSSNFLPLPFREADQRKDDRNVVSSLSEGSEVCTNREYNRRSYLGNFPPWSIEMEVAIRLAVVKPRP